LIRSCLITFNTKITRLGNAQRVLEGHHARAEKANPAGVWHAWHAGGRKEEVSMPLYMSQFAYTPEAWAALA
jgi:hypothetical protein